MKAGNLSSTRSFRIFSLLKDGKSQQKPTFVNSSKETIVRTTKFRALDESKVRVIHYRIKLTFIGLGRNISSEKTARLDEMEDGGEYTEV